MAAGWGVEATVSNGNVVSGTTDTDVRKIWGGLYSPGIISGAKVTTSASAMSYTISAGVVAIQIATGEVVLAPVPQTTISTSAAPASGNRVDIIWVRQRFPSPDNTSEVIVECGTTLPSKALPLRRFSIPAGITNTNSAVATGNIDYSIPYGASLGILHKYKYTGSITVPNAITRAGHGTIYLPTDRNVRFKYIGIHSAEGAVGFDNSKYTQLGCLPNVDGGDFVLWSSPGLHQAWQTVYFESTITLSAGSHTVNLGRFREVGPGNVKQWHGTYNNFGREGATFTVEDAGPVV